MTIAKAIDRLMSEPTPLVRRILAMGEDAARGNSVSRFDFSPEAGGQSNKRAGNIR